MESNETKERSNPAPAAFTDDDLPPHLRGRVKALVHDLSRNDLPMALLDLAHLYRGLASTAGRRPLLDQTDAAPNTVSTVIYNDDRSAIEEICEGPNERGMAWIPVPPGRGERPRFAAYTAAIEPSASTVGW